MTGAASADRAAQFERLAAGGFVMVPIEPGTKGPRSTGWNTDPAQWIRTPAQVREHLQRCPAGGLGLLHSESQTATLDIDHEGAAQALAAVGLDLAGLLASNPYRIRGAKGEKPVYRVPDGLSLQRKALSWPDPSGKKGPGGRPAPVSVFELRAGGLQDVLPGSIHPDTLQPYAWADAVPSCPDDLPELPPALLTLWERWPQLLPVMRAACPWAAAEVEPPSAAQVRTPSGGTAAGSNVLGEFNRSRTVGEVLNFYGYKGGPRGPWLYPGSESGAAGVRLLPDLTPAGFQAVYSHHAADPLGDGRPRDAAGVWAMLEHGLDLQAAPAERVRELVKDAARLLGLPEPQKGTGTAGGHSDRPAADLPAADWGEVSPLPPLSEPVEPLPVELLPQPLALWLQDEARAAGLPLEAVAAPVLTGAGGLIGHRLTLSNTPNAPAVPANLWGGLCMPPGSRKTHAVNLGAAALQRAQAAEFEAVEAVRPQLETDRERAAAYLEGLQAQLKAAYKGKKETGPGPSDDELTEAREALQAAEAALTPPRFVVNDPTVEKLGEIMRDNPDGLTLVRDELTGWLASFERAGREQDRAFWLEAANGTGSFTVDRMARGTVHIPRVCAGVLGSIQPGPLLQMLDRERGGGDGLLQRLQMFIWPDPESLPPFDQAAQREPIDAAQRSAAAAVLDRLPGLTLAGLGSLGPDGQPVPLGYTPDAQAVYDAWEVEHETQKRDTKRGEAYRSHISKQPSTFARLALIFHALDVAALGGPSRHPHPAQVGPEAAALAGLWCEYLSAHARKLWGEGRRADVLDAVRVLQAVERGTVRDGQKVAEVRKALAQNAAGITGGRLAAALAVLETCGAARVEKLPPSGGQGGRPSEVLRVHPDALQALDRAGAGGEA